MGRVMITIAVVEEEKQRGTDNEVQDVLRAQEDMKLTAPAARD
jgi:hypothetical protein